MLKTLEKHIDRKIRSVDLEANPLDKDQHSYRSGRGTESALHSFVRNAEKAIEFEGFWLSSFIDITGAFDNPAVDTIVRAANRKGIAKWTVEWLKNMLLNRRVKAACGRCTTKIAPNR